MVENAMQLAFQKLDKQILPGGLQVDIKKVNGQRRTKVMRDLRRILGDAPYELYRPQLEKARLDDLFGMRTRGRKDRWGLMDSLREAFEDSVRAEVARKDGLSRIQKAEAVQKEFELRVEELKDEAKRIAELKAKERDALKKAKKEGSNGKKHPRGSQKAPRRRR